MAKNLIVALRMESVDRNINGVNGKLVAQKVALRMESVDRNILLKLNT